MIREEKKKFIAESLAKVAEYILAIVVLGNIISKEPNVWTLIGGFVTFIALLFVAFALYPNKQTWRESKMEVFFTLIGVSIFALVLFLIIKRQEHKQKHAKWGVKPLCVDGTARATVWESFAVAQDKMRTLPGIKF